MSRRIFAVCQEKFQLITVELGVSVISLDVFMEYNSVFCKIEVSFVRSEVSGRLLLFPMNKTDIAAAVDGFKPGFGCRAGFPAGRNFQLCCITAEFIVSITGKDVVPQIDDVKSGEIFTVIRTGNKRSLC